MKKRKRIKWENIICLIVAIITLVLYLIAINDIELESLNSYRLFWIANFVFIVINSANILLHKCLKDKWRK